jgi:hypothetical protein
MQHKAVFQGANSAFGNIILIGLTIGHSIRLSNNCNWTVRALTLSEVNRMIE